MLIQVHIFQRVSTHSRPKAAGSIAFNIKFPIRFQHTAARRRLDNLITMLHVVLVFQHTAARRRLGKIIEYSSIL